MEQERQYWRDRAADARARAGRLKNPQSKRMLLGLAEPYDRLADRIEEPSLDVDRSVK
jgi:hypothetical protein